MIDPESMTDSSEKKRKYDIFRQRLERSAADFAKKTNQDVLKPFKKITQDAVRRLAGKLTAAERSYQKRQKQQSKNHLEAEELKRLIREARQYLEAGAYDRAEKTLIEVISVESRHIEAYELLGRLYLLKKEYDLAMETFTFLQKLSPEDPSVIASMGEVERKLGNKKAANQYFQKAVSLSPSNPKYIDFALESWLDIGDVHAASVMLDRLRETNPENKKIEEFEKWIEEVRQERKKS